MSGPYDTVAIANPNGGKLEAMKPVVPNPLLESEKAVFELNHGLYDFSVWIARNRSDFDKEEFSKMKALQVH